MKRVNIYVKILLVSATILFVISCAVNPVTGKKQLMLMSESQEVQLGLQYDPQVVATFGEYNNTPLLSYIQGDVTEMGKISHRPTLAYHIKVLDSPVVNAFAVPGGYIYLTRGILAQLNNEAELEGVIGHEMGHIAARHSVSQQSKQQLGQLLLIGGMLVSKDFQEIASYASQGMQLLFLKFSRDDERVADKLGVEYSSKMGFDAHKMADFFQVLQKMNMSGEQGGVPTFLSTHPDPGDRYNDVNKMATIWQDSLKNSTWKVNHDSYLQMIDGIVYGEDPRQGYAEGNTFYHPELKLKFTFPAGWKLENSPLQVNIAPSDGKALIIFSMSSYKTLDSASQKTIKDLGLTLQESKKSTVNNMPAVITVSKQITKDQTTGAQKTNMVLSYFIDYNGSIFVLHGLSAEADYPAYSGVFATTMSGFNKLTDASKLNVKPQKILVKKVQRTGTLSDTFKSFGVQQTKMDELALLNNMALTDQVKVGSLIKIVGE